MDELQRQVERDRELQLQTANLIRLLKDADLEQLRAAAEANDVDAIAAVLGVPPEEIEELVSFFVGRADQYGQFPDLRRFKP